MAFGASGYIGNLKDRMQDSMITSISEHHFLPSDKLHEIFTFDAIKGAVAELTCGPEDGIKLVDTIHGQGKRVFAILIYNNWHDFITEFRKHDALDNRLPLSENDAEAIVGRSIGLRFAREAQWAFCPYVFPENMCESHRRVERKTILPFIGAERIGSGGFSVVHKMSISPSQQNFVDQKAKVVHVVQKRLNVECSREDFEREDRNLRLLNQLQHPNIIPLWGSYMYREEYNFLFPYNDMDLSRFLIAEARYQDFQWDFTFYSALAGLASALSKTHNLHLNSTSHDVDFEAIGYHHDLRPPNVLVCADNFILSDFGLGRLRGAEEISHTPYKSNIGDYIAPESTDMNENPQTVNRAIDVWAFGCLIAEVVTYMLKGATGVQEFRARRLKPGRFPNWKDSGFYQPHGDVKNEVINWMGALRRDNPHPDLISRLIQISLDALQPNPQTRPNMTIIHQRLETLSREKHFNAVQAAFCKVQGNDVESASVAQHHQGFRFAYERLQVWGHTLAPDRGNSFANSVELSERSVITMKTILRLLREELNKRSLGGDSSLSLPLQNLIVQNVEDLWRSLPDSLVLVAEKHWKEELTKRGLSQQISSPQDILHVGLPAVQLSVPPNALQPEFEEAARSFRDSLVGFVNFDEFSNITSIADVYDFTDKLQAEQHKDGGLRNLPKIKVYLERLEGYATNIDFVIRGNHNILSLIWGPIVLLLQWSRVLDKAYDSLIDAVAAVGQIIPDFRSSISASNRSQETTEIAILFFKDILNLYRETLQFFTRPSKTVLSSAIVDRLSDIQGAKTAFAFLTYQEAKTSALSTIHSFIFQLAGKDEDLIAIVCESMSDGLKNNLSIASDLLASLIRYSGLVYLVIDGVDETSEVERGRLIIEFLRLAKVCEMVKIIFSSRPEADLIRLLGDKVVEINVHDQNKGNIQNYIDERVQHIFKIRRVFSKAQDVIKELLKPLVGRAKGMFLYARLILDMVETTYDLSEIQEELTVLPESLDAA
ncbi:nacht domain-containing protein [Xylaria curta]|nr:nacht domain-containing protein [Xylaria curta]